jgi:HD-like signal output (HDOD) protein
MSEMDGVKKAALFVDDEPNILAGLRRMLRSLRHEIDCSFAESGREALEILATQHIDVIVSDMQMPGMDGAALLATVQEKYPMTIRIILSGQGGEAPALRTAGVVHQFLAKPTDPETLKEVLRRACALQDLMKNEQLKAVVSRIGKLPSIPTIYMELKNTLMNPDCSIGEVAAIIMKDMAMSAKVLQLVNSAFFGMYTNVTSPLHAVTLLGLDTIKAMVLGIGFFSTLQATASRSFSVDKLWNHCVTTAAFAKKIAQAETSNMQMVNNSFIAGIMHDIGKLLLFSCLHEPYSQALTIARKQYIPLYQAEQQIFNSDHANVGSYLVGLWGLPGPVMEAVAFHHQLDAYPNPSFCPALAVHAADVIYYELYPLRSVGQPPRLNYSYLELAGVRKHYPDWVALCSEVEP